MTGRGRRRGGGGGEGESKLGWPLERDLFHEDLLCCIASFVTDDLPDEAFSGGTGSGHLLLNPFLTSVLTRMKLKSLTSIAKYQKLNF